MLEKGGIGVISVCANIAPRRTHEMIYNYIDGDISYAKMLQEENKELSDVLFSEVNPIPIKEACYQMNLIDNNELRLPLTNMEEVNTDKLIKVLKNQGFIKKRR